MIFDLNKNNQLINIRYFEHEDALLTIKKKILLKLRININNLIIITRNT